MPKQITIQGGEIYNPATNEFVQVPTTTLLLEHSLVSLSNWEFKWEEPFISDKEHTPEQMLDYIKFMTLTKHVDPNVYLMLTPENVEEIRAYIEKKGHANTFRRSDEHKRKKEFTTAETIYYGMFAQGIPKECEKWHLNKLLALIEFMSIKNNPGKKMSKKDLYKRHSSINKANRKRYHSKG